MVVAWSHPINISSPPEKMEMRGGSLRWPIAAKFCPTSRCACWKKCERCSMKSGLVKISKTSWPTVHLRCIWPMLSAAAANTTDTSFLSEGFAPHSLFMWGEATGGIQPIHRHHINYFNMLGLQALLMYKYMCSTQLYSYGVYLVHTTCPNNSSANQATLLCKTVKNTKLKQFQSNSDKKNNSRKHYFW